MKNEIPQSTIKRGNLFLYCGYAQTSKNLSSIRSCRIASLAFRKVIKQHPFEIDAFVLLPDHLHCIWTLPEGDADFSTRWRLIKSNFSRHINLVGWVEERNPTNDFHSESRQKKKGKPIWQRRFWEHLIRNQKDLNRHIEYIHYNPVKHGLTKAPGDWAYSSFQRYVDKGIYDLKWGAGNKVEFDDAVGYE